MNDQTKKVLMGVGYSAWFSILFISLTLLTFPWSRVRDNITVVAANSDMAVTMDSLGPAWVGGRAKNLSVGKLSTGEPEAPWITFEKLKARTGLFAVLRTGRAMGSAAAAGGKPPGEFARLLVDALGSASVDAELYGGEMGVDLSQAGDDAAQFDVIIRDVDLGTFEVSNPKFSMNPRGTLRGKSDLMWDWEDPKKSKGAVDLTIDDLVVSGLKAGAFGLPEMLFSRSEAHLKVARGKAEVNDTVFEADEVQAVVEGHIALQKSFMRSRLALKLRFKLRDDLDSLAKVAFGSSPRHKDDDGWYHYQVNGTLARPRFREAAAAASTGSKSARRPSTRRPRELDNEDAEDQKPRVSRRRNPPTNERVQRKKLHEMEDPEEIEAERERLRAEREKRREERKARREELLAKRRERQERLREDRESGTNPHQVEFDDGDFERTNGGEEEEEIIEEEGGEEEFIEEEGGEEEFIEEGEFEEEGNFDEGEYIEE